MAAFKRDFLDNHGGRRSIAGTAQELQPTFFIDIHGGRRSIAGTAQATLPHHFRSTFSPRTFAFEPHPHPTRERMYEGRVLLGAGC